MRLSCIRRSKRVGPKVWNPLSLNWLGLLKNRSAVHLPGDAPPLDTMVKRPSTVRIDLILSFMIRLISFGDRSPFTSCGEMDFTRGPLQDNNRANDRHNRSAREVESFKEFISSPASTPLSLM